MLAGFSLRHCAREARQCAAPSKCGYADTPTPTRPRRPDTRQEPQHMTTEQTRQDTDDRDDARRRAQWLDERRQAEARIDRSPATVLRQMAEAEAHLQPNEDAPREMIQ